MWNYILFNSHILLNDIWWKKALKYIVDSEFPCLSIIRVCCPKKRFRDPARFSKVAWSQGIVTKETLVFTGPDLGYARITTPAALAKEGGESSLIGYPSFAFVGRSEPSFFAKKLSPLDQSYRTIRSGLIIVDSKHDSRDEKEGGQIYHPVRLEWKRWRKWLADVYDPLPLKIEDIRIFSDSLFRFDLELVKLIYSTIFLLAFWMTYLFEFRDFNIFSTSSKSRRDEFRKLIYVEVEKKKKRNLQPLHDYDAKRANIWLKNL